MDWFEEKLELDQGRVAKIAVKRLLASRQSAFQKIDVYDSQAFGRLLVHDQVIMASESDEANYHEMIVHVPLCVHPEPRRVLVIGGGDGGTVRELLKHTRVDSIHLCEIDAAVVEVCRQHFPIMAGSLDDPRVTCHFEDGAAFVAGRKNCYDLILVDSSDPIGPAERLFQEGFYRDLSAALRSDGMVVSQSESLHYHRRTIGRLAEFCAGIYPIYQYFYTMVPTYPSGCIGFSFCSKRYDALRDFKPERIADLGPLRYYNETMHRAAFALPEGFRRFLAQALSTAT